MIVQRIYKKIFMYIIICVDNQRQNKSPLMVLFVIVYDITFVIFFFIIILLYINYFNQKKITDLINLY